LPDFAYQVYNDFRRFTCNHPEITLSGSIFLAPSDKFPIYQAAESAGDSLQEAKDQGGDRLMFLGHSIPWEQLPKLTTIVSNIVNLLEAPDNKVSRSLLNILYEGWQEKERSEAVKRNEGTENQRQGEVSIFRIWRLLYGFKRLKERHIKKQQDLTNLEGKVITDHELNPYLNVITRWAEYLTRKNRRDDI
jgi:CRISPR/Cas system-associated protein Cas10 (large subunit of type III CRISPR-Cas system)